MAYEDEVEQQITGRTYEECKEKLFNTYGKDFRITNKVTLSIIKNHILRMAAVHIIRIKFLKQNSLQETEKQYFSRKAAF